MRLRCSQSCEERRSRRFLLALCMIMFFSGRRQGPIRLPAGADEIVAGVRHAMSVLDHIRSGRASVVGTALLALVIAGPAPAQDPTKLKLSRKHGWKARFPSCCWPRIGATSAA